MTNAVSLAQQASTGVSQGFKNRIINGAMVIDQRNAGASVSITTGNQYTLDRWQAYNTQASKYTIQQNAGSVTPPSGFINYLGVTSSSAYSITSGDVFGPAQYIEGLNLSDLGWGTANAKTVTLSFWVYSSLTGTFGGSLQNNAGNRTYPFSYTISSANTWEYKTITIAGDTTGTWLTTNGTGIRLFFSIGTGSSVSGTAGAWTSSTVYSATGATSVVGTNGATFYITGVQLEVGSSATSFETRSYTTELQLCQRYYYHYINGTEEPISNCCYYNTVSIYTVIQLPVTMRTSPTLNATSGSSYYKVYRNSAPNYFNTLSLDHATTNTVDLTNVEGLSGTSGWAGWLRSNNAAASVAFSAEL